MGESYLTKGGGDEVKTGAGEERLNARGWEEAL